MIHRGTRRCVHTACALSLCAALALPFASPIRARAGGGPRSGCPAGTVCNTAIGVALRLPRGWTVAPPGHAPFDELTLVTIVAGRPDMDLHLAIEPFGTTTARDALAAAGAGADAQMQGVTTPVTRTLITIADVPAWF